MWLFTIFYASTFALGEESKGSDINRYMGEIPLLHNLNLDFTGILAYYFNSGEIDVLRIFLGFVVSYFTANGFYLIIVYGVIFGYFFSRNMWYVLDRLEGRTKGFTKILLFCLFLAIPIWNINTFRFWTGAHVFLFGLLPFLFEGKKKSLIWCLITPFVVHYSFLIALAPMMVYLFLGNRVKLYYIFFVLSLFMSAINITKFNKVVETYAPQSFVERSSSYRNEEKVESLRTDGAYSSDTVWYAKYSGDALKYTVVSFLLIIYWTSKKTIRTNKDLLRLLSFILLFYGFVNILSTIPSGYRFVKVANLLTLSFLILYLQNNIVKKVLYRLSNAAVPFLLLFIIIALRESWYSFSFMTILGNPITAIFTFGENISLNDIIKSL
jgi:hypothetical protein